MSHLFRAPRFDTRFPQFYIRRTRSDTEAVVAIRGDRRNRRRDSRIVVKRSSMRRETTRLVAIVKSLDQQACFDRTFHQLAVTKFTALNCPRGAPKEVPPLWPRADRPGESAHAAARSNSPITISVPQTLAYHRLFTSRAILTTGGGFSILPGSFPR